MDEGRKRGTERKRGRLALLRNHISFCVRACARVCVSVIVCVIVCVCRVCVWCVHVCVSCVCVCVSKHVHGVEGADEAEVLGNLGEVLCVCACVCLM